MRFNKSVAGYLKKIILKVKLHKTVSQITVQMIAMVGAGLQQVSPRSVGVQTQDSFCFPRQVADSGVPAH